MKHILASTLIALASCQPAYSQDVTIDIGSVVNDIGERPQLVKTIQEGLAYYTEKADRAAYISGVVAIVPMLCDDIRLTKAFRGKLRTLQTQSYKSAAFGAVYGEGANAVTDAVSRDPSQCVSLAAGIPDMFELK